ncbi:MAG: class I SAM-dependent methyltransferase [Promethearchaeota archaeon]
MRDRHLNLIKKKRIIERYNSSFEYYDDRYKSLQLQKYEFIFKVTNFQSKLILDAGCGTGLLNTYLSEHLSKSKYSRSNFICLDISLNMLKKIKLKKEFKEKKALVSLILSDMESLPFRESFFDLIVSVTSLQNLPDIFQGVSEMIRISKRGTEFYLSILKKDTRLKKLISKFKPYFDDFMMINNNELEDLIIQGKIR